jgi:Transcriptional regulator
LFQKNLNLPGERSLLLPIPSCRCGYDGFISERKPQAGEPVSRTKDTRRQILEAARRTLETKGLLGASTREIAREAGVADGTLYVHFADRIDLFLALLQEYLPPFVEPLRRLEHLAGHRTVRANLADVVEGALYWFEKLLPLFAPLAADPLLHSAFRQRLNERNEGPHLSVGALEAYLAAEQKLGRVHPKANPRASAVLLFGACQYWIFIVQGLGNDLGFTRSGFIKDVVHSLMTGLEPAPRTAARRKNGGPDHE